MRMLLGAALGLALAGHGAAQSPIAKLAQANGWHSNYDTARAEAQRTGKPLLVVFRCEP